MENIVIIGSGPAGLSAAIYASRANLKPLVIEGSFSGGQLTLTSEVENFPGFSEGIMGLDLMEKMKKQAERFGTRFLGESVEKLKIQNSNIQIKTNNREIQAKTVLIATGAQAMWLGLESEQRLRGKGVSACATCDGFFFRNKTVAVVGGGDVALEDALVLTKFASKVYLVHRRAEFRASKIMQERVKNNPKIEIIFNAQVEEVLGKEKVEGVRLTFLLESFSSSGLASTKVETQTSTRSKNSPGAKVLPIEGLFVAIGHKPATEFLKDSGVKLDDKGYVLTGNNPYKYMTTLGGVFAAGDCVDSVYRQAVVAAGMGVAAELEIERYLESS
jgi:thioredoxin reductase (NADPH)